MSDEPKKCPVCSGRGALRCGCWPGDCICGYDDEPCGNCEGTGWLWPDDRYDDYEPAVNVLLPREDFDPSAIALAAMVAAQYKPSPVRPDFRLRKPAAPKLDKRAKVKAARAQNVRRKRQ
jgi:hypothetical protein